MSKKVWITQQVQRKNNLVTLSDGLKGIGKKDVSDELYYVAVLVGSYNYPVSKSWRHVREINPDIDYPAQNSGDIC